MRRLLVGCIMSLWLAAASLWATPVSASVDRGNRPSAAVRLTVSPSVVSPNDRIQVRLKNALSTGISFGEQFSVERRVAGRWSLASFSPKGPWPEPLLELLPGGVSRWKVAIPRNAGPGLYRVKKVVESGVHAWGVLGDFRVR
jgi:hypothetical protein